MVTRFQRRLGTVQAQGKDRSSPILNVIKLTVAGAAAGVLVAAVALPAVGGAGVSARSAVGALDLRAEELDEPPDRKSVV